MRVMVVGVSLVVGCSGAGDPPGTLTAEVFFPGYGPSAIDLESGFVTTPGPATVDLRLEPDGRMHATDAVAALGPGSLGDVDRIPVASFDVAAAPVAGSIYVVKTAEVAAMALEVTDRLEQDGMLIGFRLAFVRLPSRPVFVAAAGTEPQVRGRGRVTSTPAGIACESTAGVVDDAFACSDPFDPGDAVTLSATAIPLCNEYPGLERPSVFDGWSGACAGTTGATCVIPAGAGEITAFPVFRAAGRVQVTSNQPTAVSVTVDGVPCAGDCLLAVPEGTTVRVSVSPPQIASFAGGGGPTPGCNIGDERGCCMVAVTPVPYCCTTCNPGTVDATSCTFTASGLAQGVTINVN